MREIDIVIVNWNAGDLLRQCVQSIAAHQHGRVASVVVVDNGSTDGSAAIEVEGLALEVVRTGRNLGFGKACNLGARRGNAPFLLFLNPDAALYDDTLEDVLAYMTSDAANDVGVCGIRLVDEHGHAHRHTARFPRANSFLGNSLGLTRTLRRWFPPVLMAEFDHLSDRSVDHVMGAFYFMPRGVFEELGGFDEDFFVYLEDLDLSRRVKAAGYRIEYRVGPNAYHRQGGTSDQVKAHRLYYALKSNMTYAAKHLSPAGAAMVVGTTLLVEPFSRTVRAILRRSPEELFFTWRGYGMLYRAMPDIVRMLGKLARQRRSAAGVSSWR